MNNATLAAFPLLTDAAAHRAQYGGWLLVPIPPAPGCTAIWFDAAAFTPTAIMQHAIADRGGLIICDNRFLETEARP